MKELGRTICEFLVVALVCVAAGLAANQSYPNGLKLTRNYFARPASPTTRPVINNHTSDPQVPEPGSDEPGTGAQAIPDPPVEGMPVSTNNDNDQTVAANPYAEVFERLRDNGLNPITFDEVVELYQDPAYDQNRNVFVDARDDKHYHEGHIPGAHQLDRFYIERYIDAVLPYLEGATRIVVYCGGGDCEDSEFAATELLKYDLNPSIVYVYVGGMAEWNEQGMPTEVGERLSGQIKEGQP